MQIFLNKDITEILSSVQQNVEWTFGDWDEGQGIGSSDVSCCVRSVIRDLGFDPDSNLIEDLEFEMIRNAVSNKMSEVLS